MTLSPDTTDSPPVAATVANTGGVPPAALHTTLASTDDSSQGATQDTSDTSSETLGGITDSNLFYDEYSKPSDTSVFRSMALCNMSPNDVVDQAFQTDYRKFLKAFKK